MADVIHASGHDLAILESLNVVRPLSESRSSAFWFDRLAIAVGLFIYTVVLGIGYGPHMAVDAARRATEAIKVYRPALNHPERNTIRYDRCAKRVMLRRRGVLR